MVLVIVLVVIIFVVGFIQRRPNKKEVILAETDFSDPKLREKFEQTMLREEVGEEGEERKLRCKQKAIMLVYT